MLEAVIDTAINALDEFENKAFANRTISIPTGAVPTLQFDLSDEQKTFLYDSGYNTTKAFFASNPDGRNTYGEVPAQSAHR
jgi:NTE family protein